MINHEKLKEMHGDEYVKDYRHQSPSRLARIMQYLTLDKTFDVADFACGNGMLMEFIAPKVKTYIGIDFSDPFIKAANEKKELLAISNAEFVCSEINEFCLRHLNTFDVGFALDFSEHVYDKEWVEILRNIRKSLKPKGRLYIHTPNAEFFLEILKSKDFIFKQYPQHIAIRTIEQNISILKEAGFNISQLRLIPHYKILKLFHPLSNFPIIGKYFKARIFIEATK
jgi:2-polyprenyl-6-hydroxyphenyl methylase / 3-demethylubiquinone-9 3-methyltransferase